MSPVTEVALYLEKQRIRDACKARADYALAAANPIVAPACTIRTIPPSAYRYPSTARVQPAKPVQQPAGSSSVIDMSGEPSDDECESDDSQKTMTYPVVQPTHIPTARSVVTSTSQNRYDQWRVPAFSGNLATEQIPQSLVQAYLQIRRSQTHMQVDAGMCTNDRCAFCRGGLLRQYYTLLERLVQIDRALNRNP